MECVHISVRKANFQCYTTKLTYNLENVCKVSHLMAFSRDAGGLQISPKHASIIATFGVLLTIIVIFVSCSLMVVISTNIMQQS